MSRSSQKGTDREAVAPEVQRQIDENLKLLYRERLLEERLPEALQILVDRLRKGGSGP